MRRHIVMLAIAQLVFLPPLPPAGAERLRPAPLEYKGLPLRNILTPPGRIYADYGRGLYGGEVLLLSTDTATRLPLKFTTLLSPSRDRYFYVEVEPDYEGLYRAVSPNHDMELKGTQNPDFFEEWDDNVAAMHVKVFRLSGEQVTTISLPRSYSGPYNHGRWLGGRWILLDDSRLGSGGSRYSLFLDVPTGAKRLVGVNIEKARATSDGLHLTFLYRRVFYVDFRPVYPMFDEPLPDFGDEKRWNAYKEKYFVRKEPRPWQRLTRQIVDEYELLPGTNKALLLVRTPPADQLQTSRFAVAEEKEPEEDPGAPEVVLIDLDRTEAAQSLKQYARTLAVLPKATLPYFVRDDAAREIGVNARHRRVLWRRSFAELAVPSP